MTEHTISIPTETITASDLHAGDSLVGKDGMTQYYVHSAKKRAGTVTVEVYSDGGGRTWELPAERPVTVVTQRPCTDCGGTGVYKWGTITNGVPANSGEHFACRGKGYQDRSDVIRNITYWNKYARIAY
jgi:hypothetical protein